MRINSCQGNAQRVVPYFTMTNNKHDGNGDTSISRGGFLWMCALDGDAKQQHN